MVKTGSRRDLTDAVASKQDDPVVSTTASVAVPINKSVASNGSSNGSSNGYSNGVKNKVKPIEDAPKDNGVHLIVKTTATIVTPPSITIDQAT